VGGGGGGGGGKPCEKPKLVRRNGQALLSKIPERTQPCQEKLRDFNSPHNYTERRKDCTGRSKVNSFQLTIMTQIKFNT